MTGTEKQIEWASKIINSLIETANAAKTLCENKAAKTKHQHVAENYIAEIAHIESTIEWAAKITDATRVIDCRSDVENLTAKSKNWRRISINVAFMAGTRL